MDFLFPLTAILSESTAKTIDKLNFKRTHIAAMHLMRLVFVGMALSLSVYIALAHKPLPDFSLIALGLMLLAILVSFASNVFDVLSLKADDLSLREPMLGFQPILAGLVGYLFFPSEREESFLIAFVLSIFIVYFGTHQRRLGSRQKKGMFYLLLCIAFEALLPTIYKQTLAHLSPEYIAFFRVLGILALASIFLPIRRHTRSPRKILYGLASGTIYALGTVASLYAIQKLGVAQTMLLLLLAPTVMYLFSYFILREKVRRGEIVSSACLALIVLFALAV